MVSAQTNASDPGFRRQGIGGSDIAAVAGLNPYKSAYELYLEKRGELPVAPADPQEKQRLLFGHLLEDAIANAYCIVRGEREGREVRVRRDSMSLNRADTPWAFAHIDRRVVGEHRGLELKNVGPHAHFESWGPEGSDQVPDHMLIQCQWYMWITGYHTWDLAALHGGNDLRIYTINYDPALVIDLVRAGEEFWFHVENKTSIEPDWSARSTSDLLRRVYKTTTGEVRHADADLHRWHELRQEALAQQKLYEKTVEGAENHIRHAMEDASMLIFADGSGYTRKMVSRRGYEVKPVEYVDFRYRRNLERSAA